MKSIQTLIFTFLSTIILAQNCHTFTTGSFEPIVQNPEDSISYVITLVHFHEVHTTKKYKKSYRLKWYDLCSFEMKSKKRNEFEDNKEESSQIKGTITIINDSIVELKKEETLRLRRLENKVELDFPKEDREDSLEEELDEESQGENSLVMTDMDNFLDILSYTKPNEGNITKTEEEAIGKVLGYLRTFDFNGLYSNTSEGFKEQVNEKTAKEYLDYIKNVYGKWDYFSISHHSMILLSTKDGAESKFNFKIKFENCEEEVAMILVLSHENDKKEFIDDEEDGAFRIIEGKKTLQLIKITSNKFEKSEYLQSMHAQFFKNFYNKKYSKIYKNCAEELKAQATKDQIENMIRLAYSITKGEKCVLYEHTFSIQEKYGGLITAHYVIQTYTKNHFISITYLSDPNNHKLAGIHLSEEKRKYD